MSTSLYEELGIAEDATPEQVRKAYKKKALLTHPDRLPQGATAEQKADSEEKFRKVNNAYEVLIDPKKRNEYDIHGVWPPLQEQPSPSWSPSGQSPSFGGWDPYNFTYPGGFFSHPRHSGFNPFHFTDPFTLFEQIFAGTPFASTSRGRHPFFTQPFNPFDRMQTDIEAIIEEVDRDPYGGMSTFPRFGLLPPMPVFPSITASSSFSGGGDDRVRWVSESYSSSSINGVTQTIRKRMDSHGNKYITRTLPDGREVHTINGVEQPSQERYNNSDPNQNRHLPDISTHHYLPLPSPTQFVQNEPRSNYAAPPPIYPGPSQSQSYHSEYTAGDGHNRNQSRRREKHRHSSDSHGARAFAEDKDHRRRH